jgi:hypothetical protein
LRLKCAAGISRELPTRLARSRCRETAGPFWGCPVIRGGIARVF